MPEPLTTIFRAAAVRDAAPGDFADFRPGDVAVREGRIAGVGEPAEVEREAKHHGPTRLIDLPDRLILPAMVNAHAHLDLTDIGPVPYGGDFIGWIEMVMKRRPQTEGAITAAVRNGLRMSREAGAGWVGDIAGNDAAVKARLISDPTVRGVSYLECFGFGKNAGPSAIAVRAAVESLAPLGQPSNIEIGIEPHAPYSASRELYGLPGEDRGLRSTHLAETMEEAQFVRDANGAFADFLQRIGKWSDTIRPTGLSPVEYLIDVFRSASERWVLAHCNYVSNRDIELLATTRCVVAYCPVASTYFGHRGHRYRDMIAAGIRVGFGTDSILCQPTDEKQPLGILPQMRAVFRRDRTDAGLLLSMATWCPLEHGTFGENSGGLLRAGQPAELMTVRIDPTDPTDALVQALLNDNLVEPLLF